MTAACRSDRYTIHESFMPRSPTATPAEETLHTLRGDDRTLVDQTVAWMRRRIDERICRPGTRVQSIRVLAEERGISRFTVVEAYERLVAHGYLESRRGSGFYVRDVTRGPSAPVRRGAAGHGTRASSGRPGKTRIDAQWLVRNMFRDLPAHHMPGSGLPPPGWMDRELLAVGLRSLGRTMSVVDGRSAGLLDYGIPQGYLPLRQELQRKLAAFDVEVEPAQIVTTSGATQAFDLIARQFVAPGDVVLVDDPAWFLMFGLFAAHGATVIGIPRLADGPDLDVLAAMMAAHKPRFYVIDSVLHNPTSTSLSPAKAFQVLKLAERHDVALIEDDVYADLHPGTTGRGGAPAIRIASLDQLARVIYVGSFSKTLAANLRVGFIACEAALAERLAEHKMLAALTTPELGERMVCRVLADGHYRKHVERLRARFDAARDRALRGLERAGLVVDHQPAVGMFLWARAGGTDGPAGIDTNALAATLFDQGYLLAPGSLFSPSQLPSPRLRFNIATSSNPGMLDALDRALQALG